MLSHELRNPLAALLYATQLFHRGGGDDDTLRQASSVIERQSKQMARLLDDLLDVCALRKGRLIFATKSSIFE